MILKDTKYSYNDLTIIPSVISNIDSRSEVNPYDINGRLPLFTAPMSTVVDMNNIDKWRDDGIYPIIPRNIDIKDREFKMSLGYWVALSLSEAEELFLGDEKYIYPAKICIDIANGHMVKLLNICKKIKKLYNNQVIIMTGNVANPETLHNYESAGIDYVRLSIGSGAACITAPQTGVHYPIASLIEECHRIKESNDYKIKLIADGGIRNYGDVIKALALGADYVMIGSVFASLYESAAPFTTSHMVSDAAENIKQSLIKKYLPKKIFYGMSTKKAQKLIKSNDDILKTSEGIEKTVVCKHTIKQWVENMEAYLKSAMSYCNSRTLIEFIGKQTLVVNSPAEINAVNK